MSRESKATKEEIQRNRDEAYLNGWDDGYAEGFGKASVAQDAAVAAALERAEGIATAQEAQANKRQAEADDEAQTDFNAGVLFGTEIGARMIAREIRSLITKSQSDALAAVRAEARRVKPLAFDDKNVAVGLGCRYLLAKDYDGWRWFQTSLKGNLENVSTRPFREKPDVVAAAQADYEARILAALEGTA